MVKNIAIVSLSSGTIGEEAVRHEVNIGIERLEAYGLSVRFMPHALAGIDAVKEHPEWRAADLLAAFRDPDIDMILCAIGGDDTYRLLPYLFENEELKQAVQKKAFLGFSDTTINHFMLHKCGLNTFYGQSFLADICEIGEEMPPYTRRYFEELLRTGTIREIVPSDTWYEVREDFSVAQIGTPLTAHADNGWQLMQGPPIFHGKILGGCLDSLYDCFHTERYADMPDLCQKYGLLPSAKEWEGKILFLETSEELMPPATFRKALAYLKERGIFEEIAGILFGKPMNRTYEKEYWQLLKEVVANPALPLVCNLNCGHAQPRCIIPFGVEATVDVQEQVIRFARSQE